MKKSEKYDELRKFISENFETTTNIYNRLHTRDTINIAYNNKFKLCDVKIAEVFKSMNIGEHKSRCNTNKKVQSGFYYVIYKA